MPTSKVYEITDYQYILGDRLESRFTGIKVTQRGMILCKTSTGNIPLVLVFLNKGVDAPPSTFDGNKEQGFMFLPFEQMHNYVDLLRNEKPVYAHMNVFRPEWNYLSTSNEGVGDEES